MSQAVLPVEAIKDDFLQAMDSHDTVILSAPPGAGKSTCLPLWLLTINALANKKIYLLQPRRIAAKNIACFLAKQLGEPVGQSVGYRLRNDSKVSNETQLEVITEGILTQIIQHDPELENCGLIVIDEFHERSLHADLAFALARDVQQGLRDDLKIVLMSATLASDQLISQLPDALALHSEGRSFPVEVTYGAPANIKVWREHALSVVKEQGKSHQGSILVFLPGVADIHFFMKGLVNQLPANMLLSPLYGDLSVKAQQQAIAPCPSGRYKLVLATNIAETSLTIEGVDLVIDCGLEKVALYQQQTLTNRLHQQAISKASAIQRAGRAGRLMPGKCIRLYSLEDFNRRSEHNITEIMQADILPLLIESARWGVSQLSELPLLELPPNVKEKLAWQELRSLEIVDDKNHLTAHGHEVSKIASHPRFAHMIVQAKNLEQSKEIPRLGFLACVLTALLEAKDIIKGDRARYDCDIRHRVSELLTLSDKKSVHPAINQIKQQAVQLAKQVKVKGFSSDELPVAFCGALLALAYPERLAKNRGRVGDFIAGNGKGISVNHEDALADEPYIVAANLSQSSYQSNSFQLKNQQTLQVRLAAPVDLHCLINWQVIRTQSVVNLGYDAKNDRLFAHQQNKVGAIVIDETPNHEQLTPEQVSLMWCDVIKIQGLDFIPFTDNNLTLLTRWRWLNQYQAQLGLPEASDDALVDKLSTWFVPFVGQIKSKSQFKKLDINAMLLSLLDYRQQQLLAQCAPTHFIGPTGRHCTIRYSTEQSPMVSLPMQELYGVNETPSVGELGNKSIPLILEILSPAKRPIQVTQDLVTFWQGSYKAVQKDMKSQYPKHYWPDDPANAQATNKVKRLIKNT